MPNPKQKVHLTAEQETLLITLYSKTALSPDALFNSQIIQ